MDNGSWYVFVNHMRQEQTRLRAELKPFETQTMYLGTRPRGGVWRDITAKTITSIKGEIATLQRTIDGVIAEQGLADA